MSTKNENNAVEKISEQRVTATIEFNREFALLTFKQFLKQVEKNLFNCSDAALADVFNAVRATSFRLNLNEAKDRSKNWHQKQKAAKLAAEQKTLELEAKLNALLASQKS